MEDPRADMQNAAVGSAMSPQRWDQAVAVAQVLCTPDKQDVSIALVAGNYRHQR